jgi:hypothetical protein
MPPETRRSIKHVGGTKPGSVERSPDDKVRAKGERAAVILWDSCQSFGRPGHPSNSRDGVTVEPIHAMFKDNAICLEVSATVWRFSATQVSEDRAYAIAAELLEPVIDRARNQMKLELDRDFTVKKLIDLTRTSHRML